MRVPHLHLNCIDTSSFFVSFLPSLRISYHRPPEFSVYNLLDWSIADAADNNGAQFALSSVMFTAAHEALHYGGWLDAGYLIFGFLPIFLDFLVDLSASVGFIYLLFSPYSERSTLLCFRCSSYFICFCLFVFSRASSILAGMGTTDQGVFRHYYDVLPI